MDIDERVSRLEEMVGKVTERFTVPRCRRCSSPNLYAVGHEQCGYWHCGNCGWAGYPENPLGIDFYNSGGNR